MHEGSSHQQAHRESPHHVKVPFTIGVTPSLVKRVALKGALAHGAYVVLHGHREERQGEEEDMVEERKNKCRTGLNSDCGEN